MKKKLFILISILTISCSNDETNTQTDKTSINLITGINLRETSDDSELQLQFGNPNILTNNKFLIYPNPAGESVYILANENVTDVWLVSANPEKIYQDVNFNNILNTNLYSEQSIISHSNFSLNKQFSKDFSMNISPLAKGYYKVFVKMGGIIYWDNLYKYENEGDNEEQFNIINSFWAK